MSAAGAFRHAAAAALLPTRGAACTFVEVPFSRAERASAAASCSSGLSDADTSARCSHTPSSTACIPRDKLPSFQSHGSLAVSRNVAPHTNIDQEKTEAH